MTPTPPTDAQLDSERAADLAAIEAARAITCELIEVKQ